MTAWPVSPFGAKFAARCQWPFTSTSQSAYVLPVAASLAWGGWLVSSGRASIYQVTAVALYVVKLADPVDRLISWLDEIQVGMTSFARIVGIAR